MHGTENHAQPGPSARVVQDGADSHHRSRNALSGGGRLRWGVGLALLLVVLCLGARSLESAGRLTTERHRDESATNAERRQPSGASAAATARDAWAVGTQRVYAIDFGHEGVRGQGTGPETAPAAGALVGTGKLTLTAEGVEHGASVVQGAFTEMSALDASSNHEAPEHQELFPIELSRPFRIVLTPAGVVQSVAVDPNVDGTSYRMLRWVVAALQFVGPSGPNPSWGGWTTQETNHRGTFASRYERFAPERYRKLVSGAVSGETSEREEAGQDAAHLMLETTLLVRGMVVHEVEMRESVRTSLGALAYVARSHVSLRLLETRTGRVEPIPGPLVSRALSASRDSPAQEELARKRRLTGERTSPSSRWRSRSCPGARTVYLLVPS